MSRKELTLSTEVRYAADGSVVELSGGQYKAAPPSLNDGDVAPLPVDQKGNLKASLWMANGTAALLTTTTSSDGMGAGSTVGYGASLGYLFNGATWDRARGPVVFKGVNSTFTSAGGDQALWTPAAGKKFRLLGFALSFSAATAILLKDGLGGTQIYSTYTAVNGYVGTPPMGNGILSGAANNVLAINPSADVGVRGFVFGVEE